MGAQFSIPTAFSLRQPPVDHRPGAGYCLPRHLHASVQEGRLFEKDSPHMRVFLALTKVNIIRFHAIQSERRV